MAWNTYKIVTTSIGYLGNANSPVTSIVMMSDGEGHSIPAVAYTSNSRLYFSKFDRNTGEWSSLQLSPSGLQDGCQIKLVCDKLGIPCIFYYSTGQQFRMIRASSIDAISWPYDITIASSYVNGYYKLGIGYDEHGDGRISFALKRSGQNSNQASSWRATSTDYLTWVKENSGAYSYPWDMSQKISMLYDGLYYNTAFNAYTYTDAYQIRYLSIDGDGTIDSGPLVNPRIIMASSQIDSSRADVWYSSSNSVRHKQSLNSGGSSWSASYDSLFTFSSSSGLVNVAGTVDINGDPCFLYRSQYGNAINFYKGYNLSVVGITDEVGNFDLLYDSDSDNYIGSYYRKNSSNSYYEVYVVAESELIIDSNSSSSSSVTNVSSMSSDSSSLEERRYVHSCFNSGLNLLNAQGEMNSSVFVLPETSNICSMYGYSGNGLYTMKLENVDTGQILCEIPHYAKEAMFTSTAAGTRLRLFVDGGSPGDVINSYEIRFRFDSEGESSSITESFESRSSESSSSSSSTLSSFSSSSSSSSTLSSFSSSESSSSSSVP